MTYDVGDPAVLAVQILADTGALTNVTGVTLTITLPDGTSSGTLTATTSTTGVYEYTYTPTMAGRHLVRWVATDAVNFGTHTTTFEVEDPAREPLIQPADLRSALRDSSITDDYAEPVVRRASALVRGYCRQEITRATWTQRLPLGYSSRGWFVQLPQRPVVSLTSIAVNGTTVTTGVVDKVQNRIALPDGIPTVAPDGLEDYADVTYVAGYQSVPGDVESVALAVAMRLYTNPEGYRTEMVDDVQLTRAGADDDLAGITLTASEKRALRDAGFRAGAGSLVPR